MLWEDVLRTLPKNVEYSEIKGCTAVTFEICIENGQIYATKKCKILRAYELNRMSSGQVKNQQKGQKLQTKKQIHFKV